MPNLGKIYLICATNNELITTICKVCDKAFHGRVRLNKHIFTYQLKPLGVLYKTIVRRLKERGKAAD